MAQPMKGQIIDGYKFLGGDPSDEKNWKEQAAPNSTAKDYGLSMLSGGVQGAMDLGESGMRAGMGMIPFGGMLAGKIADKYRSLIPEYTPESVGARYAGAATRGAVGSAPFGPMGALSGATGGLGGEAGADLSRGTHLAPYGRVIGGLAGSTIPNIPAMVGGQSARSIRNATAPLSPEDWAAAELAQRQAAAQGVQLTGPEAIGTKAPDLLAKQLMTEQNPKSAGILAPVMEDRPGQVRQAVRGALDPISPQRPVDLPLADPALLGNQVQGAAQLSIDRARQAGNAAAGPAYQAAEQQRIPREVWNDMVQTNPIVQKALIEVKKNPFYGVPAAEKEGSILWLDAAKKYLDDAGNAFSQAGSNYAASQAKNTAGVVRSAADATSPEYAQARAIIEKNMRQNVDPRMLGTTGALAATNNPVAQFDRLVSPDLSRPPLIAQTAKDIQSTQPAAYQQLISNGLESAFDSAMKKTAQGESFGGAKFARDMRVTDQTKENVDAVIKALPNGDSLAKGWNNLLDTLEKTGNRLPVGSRTAFNQQQLTDMTGPAVLRNLLSAQPLSWMDRMGQNMSAKTLAKIFTDPDSVAKMKQLAITAPNSAKARALAAGIMSSQPFNK